MGELGVRYLGRCAGGMWQQMQQDQEGPTQPPGLTHLVLPLAQRGICTPLSISVINKMFSGTSFRPETHCTLSKRAEMGGKVKHSDGE